MDPLFKTDLWAVANAAAGRQVDVHLRTMPKSSEAYVARLIIAGEFLGLEHINIFYDNATDLYGVGEGTARLHCVNFQDLRVRIDQFADDDLTTLVDGKDVLERASGMLDNVELGDDFMNEYVFSEDDDNDTYQFGR